MNNDTQPTLTFQLNGWTGIDLDGTLAHYDTWKGIDHIGEPVAPMLRKVKQMLAAGAKIRIFTARAATPEAIPHIRAWLAKHDLPESLPITNVKDFQMTKLYDDRCVYVFPNQGVTHEEHLGGLQAMILDVAQAFGIKLETGMNFGHVGEALKQRATAGNPKADAVDKALALVDAARDALEYVNTSMLPGLDLQQVADDISRARFNLTNARAALVQISGVRA